MKYLKKLNMMPVKMTVFLIGLMLLTSCSKDESNRFVINSPEDITHLYQQTLAKMQGIKNAEIKELKTIINNWLELQDSVYNYVNKDTTIQIDSEFITGLYAVSDSIRQEITRISKSSSRSLTDVTYLMINTAQNRQKTHNSNDYKTACKMFEDMDAIAPYKDVNSTIDAYESLLDNTELFTKERDVTKYLKEEDKCFRSLMKYLPKVDQDVLISITNKTGKLFDDLYSKIANGDGNPVTERVKLYLSMRFNRRILQNAEACMNDIKAKINLSDQQKDNYRWMIIQPFMSIDKYSMASLTEKQENQLLKLAEELPSLISFLDGTSDSQEELKTTTEILSDFFLNSYLKSIL